MTDPIPTTMLPGIEDFAARHWQDMWVKVQNTHNRDRFDMVPVHHSWYDGEHSVVPLSPAGIDLLVRWAWWRLTGEVRSIVEPSAAIDVGRERTGVRVSGVAWSDAIRHIAHHLGALLRIAQAVTGSLPEPGTVPRLERIEAPEDEWWVFHIDDQTFMFGTSETPDPDLSVPALAGVTDPVKAAQIIVQEVC